MKNQILLHNKNQILLDSGEDQMIFLVCLIIIASIHATLVLQTDFEWAVQLLFLANIVIYYVMFSLITEGAPSNNIYNSFILASSYTGGAILGSFIVRILI